MTHLGKLLKKKKYNDFHVDSCPAILKVVKWTHPCRICIDQYQLSSKRHLSLDSLS